MKWVKQEPESMLTLRNSHSGMGFGEADAAGTKLRACVFLC